MWNTLKSVCQSTNPARKALLLKQLPLTKLHAEEDVKNII